MRADQRLAGAGATLASGEAPAAGHAGNPGTQVTPARR